METSVKLRALPFNRTETYLIASLFVAGNLILPQLFHLIPQGGITWLPIYFFTLIGAYKFGWKVGLLTAIASPLANSLLFAMPAANALPAIILKSTLLALAAGYAAHRFHGVSLILLAGVVLAYQLVGTLGEWLMSGDFGAALQDFRIGFPGMLLQVFGGYLFIKYIIRNR